MAPYVDGGSPYGRTDSAGTCKRREGPWPHADCSDLGLRFGRSEDASSLLSQLQLQLQHRLSPSVIKLLLDS